MYKLKSCAEVYLQYYPLVCKLCGRLYDGKKDACKAAGVELEDFIQEAYFAVQEAVNAYDESKGYKLSTYFKYYLLNKINTLSGLIGKQKPLNNYMSFESPILGTEDLLLGDTIVDDQAQIPFDKIHNDDHETRLKKDIENALSELPEEECRVITYYYLQGQSVAEISKGMQMTSVQVHAALNRGLRKLGHNHNLAKRYFRAES